MHEQGLRIEVLWELEFSSDQRLADSSIAYAERIERYFGCSYRPINWPPTIPNPQSSFPNPAFPIDASPCFGIIRAPAIRASACSLAPPLCWRGAFNHKEL
jgi:hypothetical protein